MTNEANGAIHACILRVVKFDSIEFSLTKTRLPCGLRFKASCSAFLETGLAVAQLICPRVLSIRIDGAGRATIRCDTCFEEPGGTWSANGTGRRCAFLAFVAGLAFLYFGHEGAALSVVHPMPVGAAVQAEDGPVNRPIRAVEHRLQSFVSAANETRRTVLTLVACFVVLDSIVYIVALACFPTDPRLLTSGARLVEA